MEPLTVREAKKLLAEWRRGTGTLLRVRDAAFLTGYSPRSIRAAIRAGELEAIERIYYRSTPDGRILKRRYYAIPDGALHRWIEGKLLRPQADGQGWKRKPGRKPSREPWA